MPRVHDFARDPSRSDEDYIWSVFRERPLGRGEVSETDLWGPGGILLFSGVHHQFSLKAPDGSSPYDNDLVDPVYRWLDENTIGAWNWLERQTNNWRSVATSVYVGDDADIEAFKAEWGHLFTYEEDYTRENARWIADDLDAQERGELPDYLTASRMQHILMSMAASGSTSGWLRKFQDRAGFDDLFIEGLDKAVARAIEAEPSEYGARTEDGQWNDLLVDAFKAVGDWVRDTAPVSLQERLKGYETGDEALSIALGSKDDSPAIPV
ncbi:hypothetical protein G6L37_07080 [Agrobacterium rubi]|nr:hypothetical protein [Agrobacterium rubi]NTF25129.1 hypothetical protein [Agrobacterium rubi]